MSRNKSNGLRRFNLTELNIDRNVKCSMEKDFYYSNLLYRSIETKTLIKTVSFLNNYFVNKDDIVQQVEQADETLNNIENENNDEDTQTLHSMYEELEV